MRINHGMTDSIRDYASRASDVSEMKEILSINSPYYTDWGNFVNSLFNDYGYNISTLAEKCGFSRNTVRSWKEKKNMPKGRKEFIKLGFGIYSKLDDINYLLQRYGKYPKLYAKSLEDAVYIYAFTHRKSFAEAQELIEHLNIYLESLSVVSNPANMTNPENTELFQKRILKLNKNNSFLNLLEELKHLEGFVKDYIGIFNTVYNNLIAYIDKYVDNNYADTDQFNLNDLFDKKESASLNALLYDKIKNPQVISYFNDMVSSLRVGKVVPNRLHLVALGIHLDMNLDELDMLLELANIEKLCGKDKVELAVVFTLEHFLLNDPSDLVSNKVANLHERFRNQPNAKEYCSQIINKYYEADEYKHYAIDDYTIATYMADILADLNLEEANDLRALL